MKLNPKTGKKEVCLVRFGYAELSRVWEYAVITLNEIQMCVRHAQMCLCMCVCTVSVLMMQNQLKNHFVRTAVYVSIRAYPLL